MTSPPPPSPVPPDSVLARYLAGEAGPDDTAAVESWAAAAPENSAELRRLREAWKERGPAQTWDVDRAWARVAKETAADGGIRRAAPVAPRSWTANPLLRIAAGIVLVVGVSFAWRAFIADTASPAIAYSTQQGEQREVELPDGTRVTLSPATELVVAEGYGRGERRVDLTGDRSVREYELVGCAPADAFAGWPHTLAPVANLKPTQLLDPGLFSLLT